jgi:hypothetical protein
MLRTIAPVAAALFLLAPAVSADIVPTLDLRADTQRWAGLGGFQFLKVSQGARAVGMGDAFTAVGNDVTAIFSNPAGLTEIQGVSWTTNYTKWLVGSSFFSGAVAVPLGGSVGGVLGLSVVSFQAPTITETTIYQPNGTGNTVNAGDMAAGLVYAVKMTDQFSFSGRVSYIRQALHTTNISAVAVDLGTMYYTGFRSLRLAMALRNFGPDKKVLTNKFFVPLSYHVGLAAETYGERGDAAYLTLSGESVFASDYEMRAHLGAELWIQNTVALRGGYKLNYDTDTFSLGAGLRYEMAEGRDLVVDVSYSDMGSYFTSPIRVSVGGTF